MLSLILTACGSNGSGNDNKDGNQTDNNKPVVTLKGDNPVKIIIGHNYTELGADATDNLNIDVNATVDTFKIGEQVIKYTATDKNGKIGSTTRTVIIEPLNAQLPHDTNLYFAPENEKGYLYFADPQPEEHGQNRIVRVNYETMDYNVSKDSIVLTNEVNIIPAKDLAGANSNPHSVDRAGDTDRFYVRTQNSYSFDVIKANATSGKLEYLKTVKLEATIDGTSDKVNYSPRAFGAYNKKYNIQIVSGRNSDKYTIVGVIDVNNDEVIKSIAYPINGTGSATTGHAKWLDENHFAVVDRGNKMLRVYKVSKDSDGNIVVDNPHEIPTTTPIHALERVTNPKNERDLNTFYALGSSAEINGNKFPPMAMKFIFDPITGSLNRDKNSDNSDKVAWFKPTDAESTALKAKNIPLTTHHAGISPDGKYLMVPVYNGKIHKIDRDTMLVEASLDTGIEKGLGAAHIEFSKSLNLAVITNHWSPYITIIDIADNKFEILGYVKIYRDGQHDVFNPNEKHLMQPHFAQISNDGKYFYTFASQDRGRFVRVNLEEVLKLNKNGENVFQFNNNSDDTDVMKSFHVEGAPEQAHS